jgi:predicted NAD/FAD-dependent oxidoreductase
MITKKQNIAIIGAGISGLSLANMLKDIANVKVFEKSRGFGGRVATRYSENFEFDQVLSQNFHIRKNKNNWY